MTNHKLKLITTQDGSHSLMREDLHETYHSFHGAMGESRYVFVEQGLEWKRNQGVTQLNVLEVGFGTGLNAYLSALFAEAHQLNINFHTLEPIPVPRDLYTQLNYGSSEEEIKLLQALHECPWEEPVALSPHFSITKYQDILEAFESATLYDLTFFDAFAPSKQSEVWELKNLQKCCDLTKVGGGLTTYCAQGQFKRNLATAGYTVETLKGAMGKKEMVRGVK